MQISGETYHYTSYAERMATDAFVAGGGASRSSKAHSSDFHLKIRVSSAMCTCTMLDYAASGQRACLLHRHL